MASTPSYKTESSSPPENRSNSQRLKHARFFAPGVLYHVIFRTQQGYFFLRPDRQKQLRSVIVGILGRAQSVTFPEVKVHAFAALSNHVHMAVSSDQPDRLAQYIGYIKKEISRRWRPPVEWEKGLFESGYNASAVLSHQAQIKCLKYILSQSVKEGLVEDPRHWPGFHCADALMNGTTSNGTWFDGTGYGRAKQIEDRKPKQQRRKIRRVDFVVRYQFKFSPLPSNESSSPVEYQGLVAKMVEDIVSDAQKMKAGGRRFRGIRAVLNQKILSRSPLPPQPWFENRRRMIVWDSPRHLIVREYLAHYWAFQSAFRQAANRWKNGDLTARFPPGAYRPGLARAVPHPHTSVAVAS